MRGRRPKEIVSYNMSKIRSKGTKLEARLEEILKSVDVKFDKHLDITGKPDFAISELKIAIFADSDFWHGYNWDEKKNEIKTNREFWYKKIERNIKRDKEVFQELQKQGWRVIRYWGHEIINTPDECQRRILDVLEETRSVRNI